MTTKEYLVQAYRIDQRINSKLEQIVSLRELATKATSTLTETPSRGKGNVHSMEGIILRMMEIENEINVDINMLIDLKKEIMAIIKSINNPEQQTILELRYLCFKTWEQIALDMGYSIQNAYKVHDRAVGNIVIRGLIDK
ncbi:MAG: DUF1492 domain-containing protein [Clostridium sp.]